MFKNAQIYRLPAPWTIQRAALEEQLGRRPFVPCPASEPYSRGWGQIQGAHVHAVGAHWFLRLDVEERKLSTAAINLAAQKRAEELESIQGYKPSRQQMRELRERIAEENLPKVLPTRRSTAVWIDPQAGFLVIDAASASRAEEVIEHLRHCLDEFPLSLVRTRLSPVSAMAGWLAGVEPPLAFTVDRECVLQAVGEEKAKVQYTRHPLEGDEVKGHLAAGKLPVSLAMTWNDRLSFVLTEKLEFKRLAFLDIVAAQVEERAEELELADADRLIMAGELSRFIPGMLEALGGEITD